MADGIGYATPSELVKGFSWELDNKDNSDAESATFTQLRRDLVEHVRVSTHDREEEIRRLESHFLKRRTGDEVLFRKTRHELIDHMQSFQSLVPEELRTTIIPKSWSDVETAVSNVQNHWESRSRESKTSQAKGWLRKMCDGLHNHKTLLEMLPKESEYVSVIAGAVTMIIKASANYTKISESFASGIIAINDAVALVQGNEVYTIPRLQELSMRLYTSVFSYLAKFMTWFRSKSTKRMLWSLNENLAQTFAEDIQQVKNTSTLISQHIQLFVSMDVRISKLHMQGTKSTLQHLIDLVENAEAQRRLQVSTSQRLFERLLSTRSQMSDEDMEKIAAKVVSGFEEAVRQRISGQAMSSILERQVSKEVHESALQSSDTKTRAIDEVLDSTPALESLPSAPQREPDTKLWSAHLEDHYNSEQICPFPEAPQEIYTEAAFVSRLSDFTTTLESQILYAMTPFRPSGLNLLRRSAAKYASLVRANDIPVISFFCLPSSDEPNQHIALLYALIRQVVELLDDSTLDSEQLIEERMRTLEGKVDTWDTALQLFSDMTSNIRARQLVFVIDGVNLLEDDSDHASEKRIRGLVSLFKELACPGAVDDCIIKVLFTSAGRSSCLCDELESDQMLVCDVSRPVGKNTRKSQRYFSYET